MVESRVERQWTTEIVKCRSSRHAASQSMAGSSTQCGPVAGSPPRYVQDCEIHADTCNHFHERLPVLVSDRIPERAASLRMDFTVKSAECCTGVTRYDVVLLVAFGEDQFDTGSDLRFLTPLLLSTPTWLVAVRGGLDGRHELGCRALRNCRCAAWPRSPTG